MILGRKRKEKVEKNKKKTFNGSFKREKSTCIQYARAHITAISGCKQATFQLQTAISSHNFLWAGLPDDLAVRYVLVCTFLHLFYCLVWLDFTCKTFRGCTKISAQISQINKYYNVATLTNLCSVCNDGRRAHQSHACARRKCTMFAERVISSVCHGRWCHQQTKKQTL